MRSNYGAVLFGSVSRNFVSGSNAVIVSASEGSVHSDAASKMHGSIANAQDDIRILLTLSQESSPR